MVTLGKGTEDAARDQSAYARARDNPRKCARRMLRALLGFDSCGLRLAFSRSSRSARSARAPSLAILLGVVGSWLYRTLVGRGALTRQVPLVGVDGVGPVASLLVGAAHVVEQGRRRADRVRANEKSSCFSEVPRIEGALRLNRQVARSASGVGRSACAQRGRTNVATSAIMTGATGIHVGTLRCIMVTL